MRRDAPRCAMMRRHSPRIGRGWPRIGRGWPRVARDVWRDGLPTGRAAGLGRTSVPCPRPLPVTCPRPAGETRPRRSGTSVEISRDGPRWAEERPARSSGGSGSSIAFVAARLAPPSRGALHTHPSPWTGGLQRGSTAIQYAQQQEPGQGLRARARRQGWAEGGACTDSGTSPRCSPRTRGEQRLFTALGCEQATSTGCSPRTSLQRGSRSCARCGSAWRQR